MDKLTLKVDELDVESFTVPGGVEETAPNADLAYNEPFIIISCFCSADC